ncbi:MAG: ABC transporter substrate-binding protein [Rhodocyclaceae bacterium]|jgi:branched-chain amino acid transport system substrate-binding protein|uniref:ABC transporter permease n=1 Tax=Candidatus Desulfobacillus denitrificans TaxID=2608985 RepID=A0A809RNT0_9PROT|nr:ABC transporter substrate-binding protein [Rhodocyclaceae bacterium]BBO21232.1 ABC transporter permease [Candidatus Desulfobacillus denitrificans]GIK46501.1 MAG: ABC transporter substrate-binding protein [Betaproteobacteria bacterium]GJQ53934.1 MAG: ABC transporter substrate-binding protein [Rhodocyclaceae bacterium]
MSSNEKGFDRREFLKGTAAVAGATAVGTLAPFGLAQAQSGKIKVGLMLPYTGTYAALGVAITNGFKLAVEERGGKLGGREIEYIVVDDESNPAKAPENANKLIQRDKVDVVIGTVHSGVALGMAKVIRETGTLWINPNAGADEVTGPLCAPNIFRTSFSNWQSTYALGKVLKAEGRKTAVFITWKYAAGEQMMAGFKEGFEKEGGKLVKELYTPFPQVEFQALLTEIASIKPDAVVAFFAGGGAAKFLKDYAAAGLKGKIPLYGSGFLTDGVLEAVGDAAEGVETTLHYADSLNTKKDNAFRLAYAKTYKLQPDVYAVQGYDAGQLLAAGLDAVKGDISSKAAMIKAMEAAKIDSPRGTWTLSKAHNPVQDMYLRKVVGKQNLVQGVAFKALADPARGCKA